MIHRKCLEEGTVFLVPLRDTGYATGVLAKASGEGHVFGYFFGPRVDSVADANIEGLRADEAILIGKFGDLELLRGNWPVVDSIAPWDPSMWPMTPLARIDESARKAWLSTYDEEFNCVSEEEIDVDDAQRYPYDRMMGAGSVEIRLTKLLEGVIAAG